MCEIAIEILNKISEAGFEAYIVGGYPRNKYLGIDSDDIDICTSATPDDLLSIFPDVDVKYSVYGAVRLRYAGYIYEVTTFRSDKSMADGNRFYDVEYVGTLKEDLYRRDFIINTLCIDKNGNYVDCLGAINDLNNRIVRTVKSADISFREDPLRILRSVRFATTLSFSLSKDIISAFDETKQFLPNLSFYHIKHELNLIFKSINAMDGINYLIKFGIDKMINIDSSDVRPCSNYLGIWAQLVVGIDYQFTSEESKIINDIRYVLNQSPTLLILYEYGMNICGLIDEINSNNVYQELYKKMPIHCRDDIKIDKQFILSNVPTKLISGVYKKLESLILDGSLINEKSSLEKYILDNITNGEY